VTGQPSRRQLMRVKASVSRTCGASVPVQHLAALKSVYPHCFSRPNGPGRLRTGQGGRGAQGRWTPDQVRGDSVGVAARLRHSGLDRRPPFAESGRCPAAGKIPPYQAPLSARAGKPGQYIFSRGRSRRPAGKKCILSLFNGKPRREAQERGPRIKSGVTQRERWACFVMPDLQGTCPFLPVEGDSKGPAG
jgi:hypothetical protein